jgi:hypothetical protein
MPRAAKLSPLAHDTSIRVTVCMQSCGFTARLRCFRRAIGRCEQDQ